MVRIRLRRVGAKGQPSYRIVAIEKEAQRDGRPAEVLGFYNPRTNPATIKLEEERVYAWLGNGAQPSESALQVLKSAGVMDRYARMKQGESLEILIAEAKVAEQARNISTKTETVAARKAVK